MGPILSRAASNPASAFVLDRLVVAAATLAEGAAWRRAGVIDVRAASDPAFQATDPEARIALAVAPAPMIPLASVSESAV